MSVAAPPLMMVGGMHALAGIFDQGGPTGPGVSWSHYTPITIQSSQINSDLGALEVYVDLSDMPAGFWSTVQSDGDDIRVYDDNGDTEYAFELVNFDSVGDTGELWCKVTQTVSSSSNTDFRIYYGNGAASAYGTGDTYGRDAVWESFSYVAHDGGRGGTDSSGNVTPTVNGSPASATGKVGDDATTYDGTDDEIDLGTTGGAVGDLMVSAWVKTPNATEVFVTKDDSVANERDWFFALTGDGYAQFGIYQSNTLYRGIDDVDISDDAWHFLSGNFENAADEVKIFVDGVLEDTTATSTNARDSTAGTTTFVGARDSAASKAYLDGELDEVRISVNTFSDARHIAWYRNMNNTGTFYSVGSHTTN
jgi:soluble cytochrome b562